MSMTNVPAGDDKRFNGECPPIMLLTIANPYPKACAPSNNPIHGDGNQKLETNTMTNK
jgi:hypothetical protein